MMTTDRPDVPGQVERVLKPIQQFVRAWMLHTPASHALADRLRMRSENDLWIFGRAGVMGDCTPDVVAAGLGFIGPDYIAEAYAALPAGLTLAAIGTEYAKLCTEWGTAELTRFDPDRMERLDAYGRRLLDAASPAFGPVFAAWRAVPQPADVGGRVALTVHVLRELRGGAHIAAVLAAGITPLDAVLASPAPPPRSGPAWAKTLHWGDGPFRDAAEVVDARREAEAITSRMLHPVYATLDPDELEDFAELVETTRNSIDM